MTLDEDFTKPNFLALYMCITYKIKVNDALIAMGLAKATTYNCICCGVEIKRYKNKLCNRCKQNNKELINFLKVLEKKSK